MKKNKLEQAKARLANNTAGVNFNEFAVMDRADFKQMQEALVELQKAIKEGVNVKLGADISPREQLKDYGLRLAELIGVIRAGITVENIDKIKMPEPLSKIEVSNLKEIEGYKDFKSDFDGLNKALVAINESIKKPAGKNPEDYIPVRIVISPGQRLEFLQSFPIPSFGGGGSSSGGGTIDTTGLATSANQTNGGQKAQIVDSGGEAVTVTGGKLDVNASVDTTGLATSAKQDTIIGHVDGIEGSLTTIAGAVSGSEMQVDIVSGAGVQYTEGDTDASITGNASMLEKDSNTITVQKDDAGFGENLTEGIASTHSRLWDGTGYDRMPGNSTDGVLVNLGSNNDVTASQTGTWNITNVSGTVSLPTGASTSAKQDTVIGHVDGIEGLLTTIDTDTGNIATNTSTIAGDTTAIETSTGATSDAAATAGSTGTIQAKLRLATSQLDSIKTAVETLDNTVSGSEMQVDVVGSLPAGTNAIGKLSANSGVDIGDVDVTSIAAGTNMIGDVGVKPRTSGGLTIFRSIDLDESEEEVKATAGQVYGWYIYNAASSVRYVKLYNATAANVTVGTTTPVMTIPVPATSGANVEFTNGIAFSTAITAAATTGVADNDTGAPSANEVIVNLLYS